MLQNENTFVLLQQQLSWVVRCLYRAAIVSRHSFSHSSGSGILKRKRNVLASRWIRRRAALGLLVSLSWVPLWYAGVLPDPGKHSLHSIKVEPGEMSSFEFDCWYVFCVWEMFKSRWVLFFLSNWYEFAWWDVNYEDIVSWG